VALGQQEGHRLVVSDVTGAGPLPVPSNRLPWFRCAFSRFGRNVSERPRSQLSEGSHGQLFRRENGIPSLAPVMHVI
jgi:hypothetical protein